MNDGTEKRYLKCLRPVLFLIAKFLELANETKHLGKKTFMHVSKLLARMWESFTEEWRFFECRFTAIGSLVLLLALSTIVVTDFSFPFPLDYKLLLQSFVSLLAIVPTVSLAVIEISASGYSIKLSKIYRKSVYFWYLITLYIIIIIMAIVGLLYHTRVPSFLNSLAATLGVFGILYVMPYFLAILRLLDPAKAIGKLGQQVRIESLISVLDRRPISLVPPHDDPLYPLLEIASRSANTMDTEMLRLTLDELLRRYNQVLTVLENRRPIGKSTSTGIMTETIVTHKMREIIEHFWNHLRSLETVLFEKKYEQNVICLIEYFGRFCKETMKYRFIEAFHGNSRPCFSWMYEINNLGIKCVLANFWDGVACSMRILSDLSEMAMSNKYTGLQSATAAFVKELFMTAMKVRHIPEHFLPSVALQSIAGIVEGKMKYGIYDVALNGQIEDVNSLSLTIVEKTSHLMNASILPRCYERILSIALFDFYHQKRKNPGKVAKIIFETFQIQAPHILKTLEFLLKDRKVRKVSYARFNYSPKQAIDDLLQKGLRRSAIKAATPNKRLYVSDICFTIRELSRIFYEFVDEEIACKIPSILYDIRIASSTSEAIAIVNIEHMLCAMGFGALYKSMQSTALKIVSHLKDLADFEAEKSPQSDRSLSVAMLIGYLGAAAIDFGMMDVAKKALEEVIEFESKYIEVHGGLPQLNHINLLLRNYPVPFKSWSREEPYLNHENRSWLYRLSKGTINPSKKLVADETIDRFHNMYLANFLPKGY